MKIALFTDTHFGVRNDNLFFLESAKKFFQNVFFPEIDKRGIKDVIFLGDLFDRRKYINFRTLDCCQQNFIQPIIDRGINTHLIVGNHDTFFKNTNRINAIEQIFQRTPSITVYAEPTDVRIGGDSYLFVPWINQENKQQSLDAISGSKSDIMFGHLEVDGFDYIRGTKCVGGMSRSIFTKFARVFSGHFHQKQEFGAIHYLGSPYEMTFTDLNEDKGFYIFDSETYSMEFIKNPDQNFIKVVYDDDFDVANFDYSIFKEKFVRVLATSKEDAVKFDGFLESLLEQDPIKISLIEEFSVRNGNGKEESEECAEDTPTLLSKFVDDIEMASESDRESMKKYMQELYLEAFALEN